MLSFDVTNPDEQDSIEKLISFAREYAIDLKPTQADLCLRHLQMVLSANRLCNLTRITCVSDAFVLHILDSLILSRYMRSDAVDGFLDMGTGGGYPGIPLHILTSYPAVLVDASRKKTDLVTSFIQNLGLSSVSVHHARLEDFARLHQASFSSIVARALAPLPTLIELGAPFLSENGLLILSKGKPDESERERGMHVAKMLGLSLIQSDSFDLPEGYGHRSILVYCKTGVSSCDIPRRAGLAKKKPLA